ncbi:MAG: SURF1 family protein [Porticoccaceae bacterium]
MTDQPQLTANKFSWQPNARLLLFAGLMMPLLISLGYWQLDRADEKRRILAEFVGNQQSAPATLAELDGDSNLQYRSLQLRGKLDATRRLLLDNRVRNGRPGYEVFEVLSPLAGSQKILVNRGWVQASLDRNELPEIAPITGEVRLSGSLYQVLQGGLQLDDGIDAVTSWPARVGWVSAVRAEELFGEEFFAYQLRLDSDSPGALQTGWPTVAVQPEKHTAYAVQWFVMALVLLIMTLNANSNMAAWLKYKMGNR